MLLIYNDEAATANAPRERTEQILAAYGAYTEALKTSGAWLAGDRLRPTQAGASVRMANGKTNVLDGPYADTKEQLAGSLHDRSDGLRHSQRMGWTLSGSQHRHGRGAPDLGNDRVPV